MRIRCSKGLRVCAFLGHFFIRSTDLLALPACDADKVRGLRWRLLGGRCLLQAALSLVRRPETASARTPLTPPACFPSSSAPPLPPRQQSFSVEITHEETVLTGSVAYLQAALLYTSSQGERRIRVHTCAIPIVSGALAGGRRCVQPRAGGAAH